MAHDGCPFYARALAAEKERDELRGRVREMEADAAVLREALRFLDPRNATALYDRCADDFERETGLWPPGRSRSPAMGPDDREKEAWEKWRPFGLARALL